MSYGQGAVLTHGNLIANVAGASIAVKFYPSDMWVSVILSFNLTNRI